MDWLSFSIGMGGLVVAALALLLTLKERRAPLRQYAFEKQVDICLDLCGKVATVGSMYDLAKHGRRPATDAHNALIDLVRFTLQVSVILPQKVDDAVGAYIHQIGPLYKSPCSDEEFRTQASQLQYNVILAIHKSLGIPGIIRDWSGLLKIDEGKM